MALVVDISETQVDAKSPIDARLMGAIRTNLIDLSNKVGGGSFASSPFFLEGNAGETLKQVRDNFLDTNVVVDSFEFSEAVVDIGDTQGGGRLKASLYARQNIRKKFNVSSMSEKASSQYSFASITGASVPLASSIVTDLEDIAALDINFFYVYNDLIYIRPKGDDLLPSYWLDVDVELAGVATSTLVYKSVAINLDDIPCVVLKKTDAAITEGKRNTGTVKAKVQKVEFSTAPDANFIVGEYATAGIGNTARQAKIVGKNIGGNNLFLEYHATHPHTVTVGQAVHCGRYKISTGISDVDAWRGEYVRLAGVDRLELVSADNTGIVYKPAPATGTSNPSDSKTFYSQTMVVTFTDMNELPLANYAVPNLPNNLFRWCTSRETKDTF